MTEKAEDGSGFEDLLQMVHSDKHLRDVFGSDAESENDSFEMNIEPIDIDSNDLDGNLEAEICGTDGSLLIEATDDAAACNSGNVEPINIQPINLETPNMLNSKLYSYIEPVPYPAEGDEPVNPIVIEPISEPEKPTSSDSASVDRASFRAMPPHAVSQYSFAQPPLAVDQAVLQPAPAMARPASHGVFPGYRAQQQQPRMIAPRFQPTTKLQVENGVPSGGIPLSQIKPGGHFILRPGDGFQILAVAKDSPQHATIGQSKSQRLAQERSLSYTKPNLISPSLNGLSFAHPLVTNYHISTQRFIEERLALAMNSHSKDVINHCELTHVDKYLQNGKAWTPRDHRVNFLLIKAYFHRHSQNVEAVLREYLDMVGPTSRANPLVKELGQVSFWQLTHYVTMVMKYKSLLIRGEFKSDDLFVLVGDLMAPKNNSQAYEMRRVKSVKPGAAARPELLTMFNLPSGAVEEMLENKWMQERAYSSSEYCRLSLILRAKYGPHYRPIMANYSGPKASVLNADWSNAILSNVEFSDSLKHLLVKHALPQDANPFSGRQLSEENRQKLLQALQRELRSLQEALHLAVAVSFVLCVTGRKTDALDDYRIFQWYEVLTYMTLDLAGSDSTSFSAGETVLRPRIGPLLLTDLNSHCLLLHTDVTQRVSELLSLSNSSIRVTLRDLKATINVYPKSYVVRQRMLAFYHSLETAYRMTLQVFRVYWIVLRQVWREMTSSSKGFTDVMDDAKSNPKNLYNVLLLSLDQAMQISIFRNFFHNDRSLIRSISVLNADKFGRQDQQHLRNKVLEKLAQLLTIIGTRVNLTLSLYSPRRSELIQGQVKHTGKFYNVSEFLVLLSHFRSQYLVSKNAPPRYVELLNRLMEVLKKLLNSNMELLKTLGNYNFLGELFYEVELQTMSLLILSQRDYISARCFEHEVGCVLTSAEHLLNVLLCVNMHQTQSCNMKKLLSDVSCTEMSHCLKRLRFVVDSLFRGAFKDTDYAVKVAFVHGKNMIGRCLSIVQQFVHVGLLQGDLVANGAMLGYVHLKVSEAAMEVLFGEDYFETSKTYYYNTNARSWGTTPFEGMINVILKFLDVSQRFFTLNQDVVAEISHHLGNGVEPYTNDRKILHNYTEWGQLYCDLQKWQSVASWATHYGLLWKSPPRNLVPSNISIIDALRDLDLLSNRFTFISQFASNCFKCYVNDVTVPGELCLLAKHCFTNTKKYYDLYRLKSTPLSEIRSFGNELHATIRHYHEVAQKLCAKDGFVPTFLEKLLKRSETITAQFLLNDNAASEASYLRNLASLEWMLVTFDEALSADYRYTPRALDTLAVTVRPAIPCRPGLQLLSGRLTDAFDSSNVLAKLIRMSRRVAASCHKETNKALEMFAFSNLLQNEFKSILSFVANWPRPAISTCVHSVNPRARRKMTNGQNLDSAECLTVLHVDTLQFFCSSNMERVSKLQEAGVCVFLFCATENLVAYIHRPLVAKQPETHGNPLSDVAQDADRPIEDDVMNTQAELQVEEKLDLSAVDMDILEADFSFMAGSGDNANKSTSPANSEDVTDVVRATLASIVEKVDMGDVREGDMLRVQPEVTNRHIGSVVELPPPESTDCLITGTSAARPPKMTSYGLQSAATVETLEIDRPFDTVIVVVNGDDPDVLDLFWIRVLLLMNIDVLLLTRGNGKFNKIPANLISQDPPKKRAKAQSIAKSALPKKNGSKKKSQPVKPAWLPPTGDVITEGVQACREQYPQPDASVLKEPYVNRRIDYQAYHQETKRRKELLAMAENQVSRLERIMTSLREEQRLLRGNGKPYVPILTKNIPAPGLWEHKPFQQTMAGHGRLPGQLCHRSDVTPRSCRKCAMVRSSCYYCIPVDKKYHPMLSQPDADVIKDCYVRLNHVTAAGVWQKGPPKKVFEDQTRFKFVGGNWVAKLRESAAKDQELEMKLFRKKGCPYTARVNERLHVTQSKLSHLSRRCATYRLQLHKLDQIVALATNTRFNSMDPAMKIMLANELPKSDDVHGHVAAKAEQIGKIYPENFADDVKQLWNLLDEGFITEWTAQDDVQLKAAILRCSSDVGLVTNCFPGRTRKQVFDHWLDYVCDIGDVITWTKSNDEFLMMGVDAGISVETIASKLQRTLRQVEVRHKFLSEKRPKQTSLSDAEELRNLYHSLCSTYHVEGQLRLGSRFKLYGMKMMKKFFLNCDWLEYENRILQQGLCKDNADWSEMANRLTGRTAESIKEHWLEMEKTGETVWPEEDDARLLKIIQDGGLLADVEMPRSLPDVEGQWRKLRWKRGWTFAEDRIVMRFIHGKGTSRDVIPHITGRDAWAIKARRTWLQSAALNTYELYIWYQLSRKGYLETDIFPYLNNRKNDTKWRQNAWKVIKRKADMIDKTCDRFIVLRSNDAFHIIKIGEMQGHTIISKKIYDVLTEKRPLVPPMTSQPPVKEASFADVDEQLQHRVAPIDISLDVDDDGDVDVSVDDVTPQMEAQPALTGEESDEQLLGYFLEGTPQLDEAKKKVEDVAKPEADKKLNEAKKQVEGDEKTETVKKPCEAKNGLAEVSKGGSQKRKICRKERDSKKRRYTYDVTETDSDDNEDELEESYNSGDAAQDAALAKISDDDDDVTRDRKSRRSKKRSLSGNQRVRRAAKSVKYGFDTDTECEDTAGVGGQSDKESDEHHSDKEYEFVMPSSVIERMPSPLSDSRDASVSPDQPVPRVRRSSPDRPSPRVRRPSPDRPSTRVRRPSPDRPLPRVRRLSPDRTSTRVRRPSPDRRSLSPRPSPDRPSTRVRRPSPDRPSPRVRPSPDRRAPSRLPRRPSNDRSSPGIRRLSPDRYLRKEPSPSTRSSLSSDLEQPLSSVHSSLSDQESERERSFEHSSPELAVNRVGNYREGEERISGLKEGETQNSASFIMPELRLVFKSELKVEKIPANVIRLMKSRKNLLRVKLKNKNWQFYNPNGRYYRRIFPEK